MTGYRLTLRNGAVYDLDDKGAVLARSDGPKGWEYSGKWIITGFSTRAHSRYIVPLEDAVKGEFTGQGWVHDLDHGTRRMWANPTGRRMARIEAV